MSLQRVRVGGPAGGLSAKSSGLRGWGSRGQGQRAGGKKGAHRTEGSRRDSNFPSRSHH